MQIYSDEFVKSINARLRTVITMVESQLEIMRDKGATNLEIAATLAMIRDCCISAHSMILVHALSPDLAEFTISGLTTDGEIYGAPEAPRFTGWTKFNDDISVKGEEDDNGIPTKQGS